MQIKSLFDFLTAAEIADVTSGSPTIDIAAKVSSWIAWCQVNKHMGFIPKCFCKIGTKIIQPANVSITSDPTARLWWSNAGNCGWIVEGAGLSGVGLDNAGRFKCHLPQLEGPNFAALSGFYNRTEGQLPSYSLAALSGTALTIKDCTWGDIRVATMLWWGEGLKVTAATKPCDNHDIALGTIDLCTTGVHLSVPPGTPNLLAVSQIWIKTLNVFAYRSLRFTGHVAGILESQVDILAAGVIQSGGVPVYVDGEVIRDCVVNIGLAVNKYTADSPAGTPTSYVGPIIGGSSTIGSETNVAIGKRLRVNIRSLEDRAFQAGQAVAFKLRGDGSRVTVQDPDFGGSLPLNPTTSIPLSTTPGEANYNGGVGGASVLKATYVNLQVNALAPGAYNTFYFYHQRLNPENLAPIRIISQQNPLNGLELMMLATPTAAAPREARILAINNSSAPMTKGVNFFIEVD